VVYVSHNPELSDKIDFWKCEKCGEACEYLNKRLRGTNDPYYSKCCESNYKLSLADDCYTCDHCGKACDLIDISVHESTGCIGDEAV